jgi:Spy/CpxP family protein refolding chaperone
MKTRTKYLLLVSIVIAFAAAAGCGYAFRSNPQKFAALYVENVAKELALNETQTAKLVALKDVVLIARETLRTGREQKQVALLALLDKPAIDRQHAQGLWRQSMRDFDDQATALIATFSDFYDSLTPAQQQKVREAIRGRVERLSR